MQDVSLLSSMTGDEDQLSTDDERMHRNESNFGIELCFVNGWRNWHHLKRRCSSQRCCMLRPLSIVLGANGHEAVILKFKTRARHTNSYTNVYNVNFQQKDSNSRKLQQMVSMTKVHVFCTLHFESAQIASAAGSFQGNSFG